MPKFSTEPPFFSLGLYLHYPGSLKLSCVLPASTTKHMLSGSSSVSLDYLQNSMYHLHCQALTTFKCAFIGMRSLLSSWLLWKMFLFVSPLKTQKLSLIHIALNETILLILKFSLAPVSFCHSNVNVCPGTIFGWYLLFLHQKNSMVFLA